LREGRRKIFFLFFFSGFFLFCFVLFFEKEPRLKGTKEVKITREIDSHVFSKGEGEGDEEAMIGRSPLPEHVSGEELKSEDHAERMR
jgi:hypothetical protein